MLMAEDTEGLAVALVVDGLLEAAAQHSALWAASKPRGSRAVEVSKGEVRAAVACHNPAVQIWARGK